jgi:hypothetical protein
VDRWKEQGWAGNVRRRGMMTSREYGRGRRRGVHTHLCFPRSQAHDRKGFSLPRVRGLSTTKTQLIQKWAKGLQTFLQGDRQVV